ncbi:DUF2933 domain-containing protein [bacterium]|jgi:hypothetical protein|nr:DUF2933 domain-containing protein [bacterium]
MSKKHALIMVACCLIALGAAAAVLLFKVPFNNVFIILMFLLCPLSHLLMMGMMKQNGHEHHQAPDKSALALPKEQENIYK